MSKPNQHTRQFDASPRVMTAVIRHWEDDVRSLLDYYHSSYMAPEMSLVVRRLRLLVGYEPT